MRDQELSPNEKGDKNITTTLNAWGNELRR